MTAAPRWSLAPAGGSSHWFCIQASIENGTAGRLKSHPPPVAARAKCVLRTSIVAGGEQPAGVLPDSGAACPRWGGFHQAMGDGLPLWSRANAARVTSLLSCCWACRPS